MTGKAATRRPGTPAAAAPGITIERVFDAPRERVWKAWTQAELLKRWWAPSGFTTPHCTVDLRPGGKFHFCMRSPDGKDIWGVGVFREAVALERLVYVDSFADAEGNPVPPSHYGMSAAHPRESLVTVTFAEHRGKTKVTLRHDIPATVPERDATQKGWTEMMDRLAESLDALAGTITPGDRNRAMGPPRRAPAEAGVRHRSSPR